MYDEKRVILEMLRDGKISVEEAERRLANAQNKDAVSASKQSNAKPERVHILVRKGSVVTTDMRLPFSLAKMGLKFGKSASSLAEKYGIGEDAVRFLEQLDLDELVEALRQGEISLPYEIVDTMTDKGERVSVLLE